MKQLVVRIKRRPSLRIVRAGLATLRREFGFNLAWVSGVVRLASFQREFHAFRRLGEHADFACRARDVMPCLRDRTETTPLDPTYLLQDAWFARRLGARRPASHVDVGSAVRTMSVVTQFVPCTFVDIRPVEYTIPGFTFLPGSILELPFADGSIDSLSSLCVVEHIGLGRYGDPLDVFGTDKAARELTRVLAPGGHLYVGVPIDRTSYVCFNAHRVFTRDHVLRLFAGLELANENYIYRDGYHEAYDPAAGFGTGLFDFRKP